MLGNPASGNLFDAGQAAKLTPSSSSPLLVFSEPQLLISAALPSCRPFLRSHTSHPTAPTALTLAARAASRVPTVALGPYMTRSTPLLVPREQGTTAPVGIPPARTAPIWRAAASTTAARRWRLTRRAEPLTLSLPLPPITMASWSGGCVMWTSAGTMTQRARALPPLAHA